MINLIGNWVRSLQFWSAFQRNNIPLASKHLKRIQSSGAKLSPLQKAFQAQLKLEQDLFQSQREIKQLRQQVTHLEFQYLEPEFNQAESSSYLTPNPDFIEFITKSFKIVEHDETFMQCTGIESRIFDDFENALADFLTEDLNQHSHKPNFQRHIEEAVNDLNKLKRGIDPEYKYKFSSQIYLMRYFPENVYCAYLAWFLVYKSGLLSEKINILDIAAGPGTIAYGLALLLQSSHGFFESSPHLSYYSLDLQKNFQYKGLQFWREYMEPKGMNAYFRFNTVNIFEYSQHLSQLPKDFFNFVVISHCFFSDDEQRSQSNQIYQQIFDQSLSNGGYVLLIIQEKKLFMPYDIRQSEDRDEESQLINRFLNDLGLKLVWYKLLNSRNSRTPLSAVEFSKFARKSLVSQQWISPLLQQYFDLNYESSYTLDDYVILAQR